MLIARHPIFDNQLKLIGYNLIIKEYSHLFTEPQHSQSIEIHNALMNLNFSTITNSSLAFIPLLPALMEKNLKEKYFPQKCVFEINKDTFDNEDWSEKEVKNVISDINNKKYLMAYDGLEIFDKYKELIKYFKYIKIDVSSANNLEKIFLLLENHNIVSVAKNVKTLDEYDRCRKMRFQLFQGFFICQIDESSITTISSSRLVALQLISKLFDKDVELQDIAKLIQTDVTLSYKFLRLINSAYYARSLKIQSILHAVTLLGINSVRTWASLLLMSNVSDKPDYLFYTALERAKMCETLCATRDATMKEAAFLTGLFSVIDILFNQSMESLLCKISLSDEIKEALLKRTGLLGTILMSVISYQQGNWIEALLGGFEPDNIQNAFLGSIDWVTSVSTYV